MNIFMNSINKVFKSSVKAFETFPAAIGNAFAFAVVTMVRIQLDWPQQEPLNFLFNSLHWAFAFGAIYSLAAITFAQSKYDTKKSFLLANLSGVGVALLAFLWLYFFGAAEPVMAGSRYDYLSGLAIARISALMLVSLLLFIYLGGMPKEKSDFSRSLFMSHKAFFIALIYGVVIMGGTSGVARAVQALLYNDMSSKVYMYIGTIVGFMAFTIFVGYFPSFKKGTEDEHREVAQKQPRFIEILFGYIMVPIVLALTVVLLLWAGKTILDGMGASFILLSGIATAYAATGIWLHFMVTHHDTGLTRFYRKIYPIAALVILAFEAWALIVQLGETGLKLTEYWFIIVWIVAVASAVLLLLLKEKSHPIIVIVICAFAIIAVQPVIGYHALPVSAQSDRLENLLVGEEMLVDGEIMAAKETPALEIREAITDAVNYLAYANDAKLPEWFDRDLSDNNTFKDTFGFEQVWPKIDNPFGPGMGDYLTTSMNLPSGPIDIQDYTWAVNMSPEYEKINTPVNVEGENGTYQILWRINQPEGKPSLKVSKDDKILLEYDMNEYIDRITEKFPPGAQENYSATIEDMSLELSTPELEMLLLFRNISISVNPREDYINYWFELDAIYLREVL